MNEWQPIETAPKDGTLIVAIDANKTAHSWPTIMTFGVVSGRWKEHATSDYSEQHPTHWMAIPASPERTTPKVDNAKLKRSMERVQQLTKTLDALAEQGKMMFCADLKHALADGSFAIDELLEQLK